MDKEQEQKKRVKAFAKKTVPLKEKGLLKKEKKISFYKVFFVDDGKYWFTEVIGDENFKNNFEITPVTEMFSYDRRDLEKIVNGFEINFGKFYSKTIKEEFPKEEALVHELMNEDIDTKLFLLERGDSAFSSVDDMPSPFSMLMQEKISIIP